MDDSYWLCHITGYNIYHELLMIHSQFNQHLIVAFIIKFIGLMIFLPGRNCIKTS